MRLTRKKSLLLLAVMTGALLLLARARQSSEQKIAIYHAEASVVPCIFMPPGRSDHWLRPHCSGISSSGDTTAPFRLNSVGIRDKEYPPKAPQGVTRILMVGSSLTLGPGLEEKDTLPRQTERFLRDLRLSVEVINAAMVGYCTDQTAFRLRELLDLYSPQFVVYQFQDRVCPLADGAWEDRVIKVDGAPVGYDRGPFPPGSALGQLNRWISGNNPAFFAWFTVSDQLRKIAFSRRAAAASGEEEQARVLFRHTLGSLAYMRDEASAHGAGFITFSFFRRAMAQVVPRPMYRGLARVMSQWILPVDVSRERVQALLGNAGIANLYLDFDQRPYFVKNDFHLTRDGTSLLAQELAQRMAPLLPQKPRRAHTGYGNGNPEATAKRAKDSRH